MKEVPPGWCMAKVRDVGFVQLGRQRSPDVHAGANMRPYLRVANVYEDRIDLRDVMQMHFEPAEVIRYELRPGDILLNEGQSRELVGRPAMYRGELPGACFTNSLVRFQPSEAIDGQFALALFRHWLRSGRFQSIAQITTNIAHLGAGRFSDLELALPPVQEQKRIVATLEELTARSRRANEALEAVAPLLEKLRQSILAAAFRGDLTADWRAARGIGPSSRVLLGDVCQSSFYGPRFGKNEYVLDGVPTIRTTDMTAHGRIVITPDTPRVRVPTEKLEQFRVQPGDLLVTRTGSIGVMAVVEEDQVAVPSAYLIRFRFTPRVQSRFVFLVLMSPQGQEQLGLSSTAVTQPNVNAEAIKRISIPLPDVSEQTEIVRRVEALMARLAGLAERLEALSRSCLSLDSAVLAKAFRGELVRQDLNDESASVLLGRIQSSRRVGDNGESVTRRQSKAPPLARVTAPRARMRRA